MAFAGKGNHVVHIVSHKHLAISKSSSAPSPKIMRSSRVVVVAFNSGVCLRLWRNIYDISPLSILPDNLTDVLVREEVAGPVDRLIEEYRNDWAKTRQLY